RSSDIFNDHRLTNGCSYHIAENTSRIVTGPTSRIGHNQGNRLFGWVCLFCVHYAAVSNGQQGQRSKNNESKGERSGKNAQGRGFHEVSRLDIVEINVRFKRLDEPRISPRLMDNQ